jgi:hypothetical protein
MIAKLGVAIRDSHFGEAEGRRGDLGITLAPPAEWAVSA